MAPSSRRNFLTVAGAGAAGIGLSSAIGLAGADTFAWGAATPATAPAVVPAGLSGSLVAYIDDVQGDEVSLMIGDHEVVLKDSALVARIANAASVSRAASAL